jgi:hypothetical protein
MSIVPMFPEGTLTKSVDERLAYYKDEVIVDHPALTDTLEELDSKAHPSLDRRLILLVGGTGVGKSAVARKLVARRLARRKAQMLLRPEIVPAFLIELEPPDRGAFDFTTLYREGLLAMKASLIDRTKPMVERKTREGTLLTLAIESAKSSTSKGGMKIRFKSELISREVELAAIDEAISLFKTGKRKSEKERQEVLKDQADKLKTFTNKTPATIILAGAFDFFELALTTGQVARRSVIVVMPAYTMTVEGLSGWGIALAGLIGHLPIDHDLRIEEIATELFLQSIGCVGIAKGILSEALARALRAGTRLTMELVRKCYYSAAALKQMGDEMELGMKAVREMTTLSSLASKAEDAAQENVASQRPPARPLKPGETAPSHRKDAAGAW